MSGAALGDSRRRSARLARVGITAWEILAGYLLAGAPLSPIVWNDGFYAFLPAMRDLLMLPAVRIGVSSVGVGLLVMGAWDAAGLLTSRSGARSAG